MTAAGEAIFAWLRVLDELTYYELFGIASDADADEVRQAFHEFCHSFHPDRHLGRPPDQRRALSKVFMRGTEAYLVLVDAGLRGRYDAQLAAPAPGQTPRMKFSPVAAAPDASPAPAGALALERAARSPAARPFARRAEELLRDGDLQQAKLQLVMATHRDPGNPVLEAALREVVSRLAGPQPRRRG